jgi:hypothetical protein
MIEAPRRCGEGILKAKLERMVGPRYLTLTGGILALLTTTCGVLAQGYPVPPGTIPGAAPPPPMQGAISPRPAPGTIAPESGSVSPRMAPVARPPVCLRLEAQLASIDRGSDDPTRAAQVSRYEDAIRRQQAELDRVVTRSRRIGCERPGFFSFFSNQPAECGPLSRRVQDLHDAIDQSMTDLQRAQGGTADRESQRRSVLIALGQNDCGPQYRTAAVNRSRGLFESLFGPDVNTSPSGPNADIPQSSTYRTVCVRTCDGYYWPISFSTVPGRFADDQQTCQRMCPASPVALFTYRNPGEDMSQAVSLAGQPYADMPSAFLYRKQYNPACSCRHAGESWAHALQNLDDTIERGDIVVTEERAKQLSKPREQRPTTKRGGREAATESSSNPTAARHNNDDATKDDKAVRNVGPTFLPKP